MTGLVNISGGDIIRVFPVRTHWTPTDLRDVFDLGFMPYCQLYQPPTADRPTKIYSAEWKAVMRKWCRPAAYMGREPHGTL
jgi:hypothetical protein